MHHLFCISSECLSTLISLVGSSSRLLRKLLLILLVAVLILSLWFCCCNSRFSLFALANWS